MFSEQQINKVDKISSYLPQSLEKGAAIDALQYDKALLVKKSGKYVKEKLKAYCEGIETELTKLYAVKDSLKAMLPEGVSPDQEPSSYLFNGIRKSAFGDYPKMFSYEAKKQYRPASNDGYEKSSMEMTSLSAASQPPVEKGMSTYEIMCKYNECARHCIELKSDSLFLYAMKDAITDNQQIEISPKMLKLLV